MNHYEAAYNNYLMNAAGRVFMQKYMAVYIAENKSIKKIFGDDCISNWLYTCTCMIWANPPHPTPDKNGLIYLHSLALYDVRKDAFVFKKKIRHNVPLYKLIFFQFGE